MKLKDLTMVETDMPKGIQALVDFGKYELSIICNERSYGGQRGGTLYEIGVFKGNGMVELPGITEPGDTVKGWLTESAVDAILTKMYTITGKEGVQI